MLTNHIQRSLYIREGSERRHKTLLKATRHAPTLLCTQCVLERSMNAIEAHCYVVQYRQTDLEQIPSRINNNWAAGRFGLSLRLLRTKLYASATVLYIADEGL